MCLSKLFRKHQETQASPSSQPVVQEKTGLKEKFFVFAKIPNSLEEFKSLNEAELKDPFQTAALTVLALCIYKTNRELCFACLDFLQGPTHITNYQKQFINDRLSGKEYKPFSYFKGAEVDNGYVPNIPYVIMIQESQVSYAEKEYCTLLVKSSGADAPRQIRMRIKDGTKWYLWDQFILADIRPLKSAGSW
jgi:hypothetical protein